jgi:NAD/NADP transhydrogenase beta subunit
MGTGYADIQNPVFFKSNTLMLLGNAKPVLDDLKKKLEEHYNH